METIAILGTGLMGASLGLALKRRGVPVRIHAYARRAETREAAVRLGATDVAFADPAEAVRGAGRVVFCLPVLTIPAVAAACRAGLCSGAVLTDVGSTKAALVRQMAVALEGAPVEFVGSHPICGSEQQGLEAGRTDLYEGAMTVVTPSAGSTASAVEAVSTLWKQVGARVTVMDADEHDRILATTSHLPHAAAAAVVLSAGDNGLFCGSGFRDTTRIAAGSPEVWRDIFLTNRQPVLTALEACRRELDRLTVLLERNDAVGIEAWLAQAAAVRRALLECSGRNKNDETF